MSDLTAWNVVRTTARRHRALAGAGLALVVFLTVLGLTMPALDGLGPQRTDEPATSLPTTDIERGRLMVREGNIPAAETILWGEYLAAPTSVEGPSRGLSLDPAYWALRELYAKNPCLATARLHDGPVRSLAFAQPSLIVAAADDGVVTHWDTTGATPNRRVRVGPAGTQCALSGNGRRVARWDDKTIEVFELEDGGGWVGKIDAEFMNHEKFAFSYSGEFVIGAADFFTSLWAATGNHVREIQIGPRRRSRRVHAVAAGAEGRRAATVSEQLVKFYDASSDTPITAMTLDARPDRLAMSADGNWAAVITRGIVRVYAVEDGREVDLERDDDVIEAVAFSFDGSVIAAGGSSRRLRIWEPAKSDTPVQVVLGHREAITAVAVGPDAQVFVSGDAGGTIKQWARGRSGGLVRFATPNVSPHMVRIASDGALMASCGVRGEQQGIIELRDPATGAIKAQWPRDEMIVGLAILPGGDRIVTCGLDGFVRVWDAATGAMRTVYQSDAALRSLAVSPDGRLAAVGSDLGGEVRLIDLESGRTSVLEHHRLRVPSVAFAPDGRHLVTASGDGTAAIWHVASRELRHVLDGHAGGVRAARFHPDAKRLATAGDDGSVRLWDVDNGASVAVLAGHEDDVFALAFTRDGRMLASGDRSGDVRLWDVAAGRNLAALDQLDAGAIMAIEFAPDGRTLVVAAAEAVLARWDLAYGDRFIAGNRPYWTAELGAR